MFWSLSDCIESKGSFVMPSTLPSRIAKVAALFSRPIAAEAISHCAEFLSDNSRRQSNSGDTRPGNCRACAQATINSESVSNDAFLVRVICTSKFIPYSSVPEIRKRHRIEAWRSNGSTRFWPDYKRRPLRRVSCAAQDAGEAERPDSQGKVSRRHDTLWGSLARIRAAGPTRKATANPIRRALRR